MAIPTVQDLIDELSDYGGHLPVKVEAGGKPKPLVITDETVDGEITVVILAE